MAVSPTGSLALTAVTVTGGRWAKGQPLSVRPVLGVGIIAVFIAFLSEANPEFAGQFALLIFVGSLFVYGPALFKKLGF